jgi:hypothetical protein
VACASVSSARGSLVSLAPSVHGAIPSPVTVSSGLPVPAMGSLHGTVTVHGATHVLDATVPPAPTRRHGTPAPVVHPIVVTHDEGHTHAMVTRQATGVTLKLAD